MTAQKFADDELDFVERDAPIRIDRGVIARIALMSQRAKCIAINVFLAFHILAATCWSMPIDSPLILCKNLVRPYFLWAGLFQSWDMFAQFPKGPTPTSRPPLSIGTGRERSGHIPESSK